MQLATPRVTGVDDRQEQATSLSDGRSALLHKVLLAATSLAIFLCDWFIELGVAIGVAYVLVVWMADRTGQSRMIWAVAILCSLLTIVGFLKSPAGGEVWKVLTNRGLSLLVIWLTAYFVVQRHEAAGLQKELNCRLAESNEALTQSNIDLQQFAFVASHDLQSPLRQISGFVQLLQKEYDDKLDEEAHEWIGYTVTGVEKMQTLIRDLLTFSRVESRSAPFEAVTLEGIVDSAIEIYADDDASITRGPLPTVAGDPSQLEHVFQNLIGNAIKYKGEHRAVVHVSAEEQGRNWIISVHDNGLGIDARHHERIFEMFRRLHTAEEYPGTGIGLAICRRIVHRHGGRIWVESEQGEGATFKLMLPKRQTENGS